MALLVSLAAFAGIVVALRRRVPGWIAFLAGSLCIGLAGHMPAARLLHTWGSTALDPQILSLAAAVGLLAALGAVMRHLGQLDSLVQAILRNRLIGRFAMAVVPGLLGAVLVGPGSAAVVGPLADAIGEELQIRPQRRLWLTHVAFHTLRLAAPYLPSLLLSVSITQVSVLPVVLRNLPPALGGLAAAALWGSGRSAQRSGRVPGGTAALLPLATVVLGMMVLHLPLALCVVLGILASFAVARRLPWRQALAGIDWPLAALMVAIPILERTMLATNVLAQISRHLQAVPPPLALALLPFLLTLVNPSVNASMGISLPLLLPYVHHSSSGVALVYAGAVAGQIASPVNPDLLLHEAVFRPRGRQNRTPLYGVVAGLLLLAVLIYSLV